MFKYFSLRQITVGRMPGMWKLFQYSTNEFGWWAGLVVYGYGIVLAGATQAQERKSIEYRVYWAKRQVSDAYKQFTTDKFYYIPTRKIAGVQEYQTKTVREIKAAIKKVIV